ncbi:MAG: methyltransferase domain-containing protein [Cytophagales bacterium]|nr:MAG: methyltransferase domain-containing protein [Cytophagales bacterium]
MENRSNKLELLDANNIPTADLFQNLKELNIINTYLGGHKITINALSKLSLEKNKSYTLVDVACGGGDSLKAMAIWARKNKIKIRFTGIDLKNDCILYAKNHCKDFPEISFITSDFRDVSQKFDITTCALFCHHLKDVEVIHYLKWCVSHSNKHFIINDLHRNWIAKTSISVLTYFFSKSYLVKNDAPLSVARGFIKNEWEYFLKHANISNYSLSWKWAFRYVIIVTI